MTQHRTDRLNKIKSTTDLATNDLGLFATAVVLRGRRMFEARAPKALDGAERFGFLRIIRLPFRLLGMLLRWVGGIWRVVMTVIVDLMAMISRNTIGRIQELLMVMSSAMTAWLHEQIHNATRNLKSRLTRKR
jgi:hypothetical protein